MYPDIADLESVTARLWAAGCVAAEEEAGDFLAAAPDPETLEGWLARREAGEPPAWIIGSAPFAGLDLRIGPGVYVPRAQSEGLARRAAALLPPGGFAVDLCCGCGAIAAVLAKEVPTAKVVGVDIDPVAARWAARNGVAVVVGDLGMSIRGGACADLITAVAPYVPTPDLRFLPADVQRYEPRSALDGGGDGLDFVRRVVEVAVRLLRRPGTLVVELGGDQDLAVTQLLVAHGFDSIRPWRDDEGDLRGLVARIGCGTGSRGYRGSPNGVRDMRSP